MFKRVCQRLAVVAVLLLPTLAAERGWAQHPTEAGEPSLTATPNLIREIQFMLSTVGIDPGPLDGNSRQLTNRAIHIFQQRSGLPITDIVNDGQIPAAVVDRLRKEAAQALLKSATPPAGAAPSAAASPPLPAPPNTPALQRAAPAVPPPDRFVTCTYSTEDFRIGAKQYTPQTLLDEGFDGVTARAVANMRQRLDEARQIADKIGGPALVEVQRQAHVLAYFECRQKIEQAEPKRN
jgi:peptidoglycan hydrolase-like protein with peptidoglycan-binding domain